MNSVCKVIVSTAMATVLLAATAAARAQPAPASAHPQLVVQTLDGKTFNLSAERGRWVIVNFWATWCGPCIEEMPAISKFVASHKNVTAIGLAWDNSPRADIVKFANKHPVDYPLAQVPTDRAPGGFPAPLGLPTSYLVAPDGHIAKPFIGPVTAKLLAQAIAEATVAGKPSPKSSGH